MNPPEQECKFLFIVARMYLKYGTIERKLNLHLSWQFHKAQAYRTYGDNTYFTKLGVI